MGDEGDHRQGREGKPGMWWLAWYASNMCACCCVARSGGERLWRKWQHDGNDRDGGNGGGVAAKKKNNGGVAWRGVAAAGTVHSGSDVQRGGGREKACLPYSKRNESQCNTRRVMVMSNNNIC